MNIRNARNYIWDNFKSRDDKTFDMSIIKHPKDFLEMETSIFSAFDDGRWMVISMIDADDASTHKFSGFVQDRYDEDDFQRLDLDVFDVEPVFCDIYSLFFTWFCKKSDLGTVEKELELLEAKFNH